MGDCVDSPKALLTGECQESAGIEGKVLAIGYGFATVSRAATQLILAGDMQQDRRGRFTFWRTIALEKL